ncbi:choice-of-anchor J domain-containing protein [Soonwooa sp.]|uniref:T9SS-dependent choice-of-anchor J family protein n=1 Tax=Soonwooa sp. TaxID=1938592 RepID=UPI00260E12F8|nr:choice-of-anchor J domain-containing protein [Soonwooa sp.]
MKKTLLFCIGLGLMQTINAQNILTEGFEGPTFPPAGWTTFIGTNGLGTKQNWKLETRDVHNGSKAAYVQYEKVAAGELAEDWMVSPLIDLTNAPQGELSFYTRKLNANQTSNQSTYYIKVSTTSQTDHSSFSTIQTWNENQLAGVYNVYEKKTVDLSAYAGQKVYIAFVMTNNNANSWFVDDIEVNAKSTEVVATLPYSFGFETDDSWKLENGGKTNNWTIEENNSFYQASEGTKYARYRYDDYNAADSWYISKGIALEKNQTAKIEFDYRTGGFNTNEKLKVAIGKKKAASDMTNVIWDNNGEAFINNTGWKTGQAEFTATEAGTYYLGFQAYSDPKQMYLFIDNIKVSQKTLAVNNVKQNNLSIYPNPISDKLNLKSDIEISTVSIYSIDGKLVKEAKINAKEVSLEVNNLSSGNYVAVVKFKNNTQTTVKLQKK